MVEGFLNALYGNRYEAHSAGIEPTGINPYATRVMEEVGIDISTHRSKSFEEFHGKNFMLLRYVTMQRKHAPSFQEKKFFIMVLKIPLSSKVPKMRY